MINLPIRFDYYQYCVETWQDILKKIDFSNVDTIIDVCPGWAPKIELALITTNFRGTVYAIDEVSEHLEILQSLTEPFSKNFKVTYMRADVLDPKTFSIFSNIDMLIGNHILDDMLFSDYCKKYHKQYQNIFLDPTLRTSAWNYFLRNEKEQIELAARFVRNSMKNLTKQGMFLFSQYQSYPDRLASEKKSKKVMKNIIYQVCSELEKETSFSNISSLLYPLAQKELYFKKEEFFAFTRSSHSLLIRK